MSIFKKTYKNNMFKNPNLQNDDSIKYYIAGLMVASNRRLLDHLTQTISGVIGKETQRVDNCFKKVRKR